MKVFPDKIPDLSCIKNLDLAKHEVDKFGQNQGEAGDDILFNLRVMNRFLVVSLG